jgi:hypothetical protein
MLVEYRLEDKVDLLAKYNKQESYDLITKNYYRDVATLEEDFDE